MTVRETFHCTDWHVAGAGVRIVESGYPPFPTVPASELRAVVANRWDEYRRWLMWEPWGHQDLTGSLVLDREPKGGSVTVVFLDAFGYPLLHPTAALALAAWLVATNRVRPEGPGTVPLTLDTPAGQVECRVEWDGSRVASAAVAVPTTVTDDVRTLQVDGVAVQAAVVQAGATLAVVDAAAVLGSGAASEADRARDVAGKVLAALGPVTENGPNASGVVLTTGRTPEGRHRHIVVSSEGQVDRSPSVAAVAARLALMAREGLPTGSRVGFESLLGTRLEGWRDEDALTIWVSGVPWITGYRRFVRDPDDAVMPFLIR